MGMYAAKSYKATWRGAIFSDFRNNNSFIITYNYTGYFSPAINKKADLTAYFMGNPADITRKFKGYDKFRRDTS